MSDQYRFRPTTRTIVWSSGLVGVFVTWTSGWGTPVWEGAWAYVGIPVGFVRKVFLVGAVTFVVLLFLREIAERTWSEGHEQQ